jgi:hypothetical protein
MEGRQKRLIKKNTKYLEEDANEEEPEEEDMEEN